MKVNGITSGAANLILKPPIIAGRSSPEGAASQKSIGEVPPIILSLENIGELALLFEPTGLVGRLRKKLNHLKRKKCKVVPAKGTTACVDDKETVYLGVDFLDKYQGDPETLAGVMAHEWGHACALKPDQDDLQELNWDQIFELRRAHETLADEISGRLLFMMGYTTKGIVQFLTRGKETHNLKYHSPQVRAQVVEYGFQSEKRKAELARSLFPNSIYENEYKTILLDIS